jgi:hypothetical protein
MVLRLLIALAAFVSSAPALAQDGTAVPEGSHLTLFALGLVGVIIGRRASMRVKKREPREPDHDS